MRVVAFALVIALLTPSVVSAITYDPADETSLTRGTVTSPANGTTIVSVQGYTFQGNTNRKKPARLIAAGERGQTKWVHNDEVNNGAWFFDVDPMPNGNLLVSSPRSGETVVYELNPETQERVWEKTFDIEDTHDVDVLSEDELVIANMREWNDSAGVSDDRIFVYNRTSGEVTWEWYFKNHFPADTDGGYNDDWSHVNDVDPVGDDKLALSPRNFDQVVVVDMETKNITHRLGSDDNYDVLNEQHNPDWMVSENGTPTLLVADSGNNRIVEYAYENRSETSHTDGEWVRTWTVGTGSLKWPRDADRLPNGNTLIVDTLNHRVIEVTPTGEVVWEYYATWGPYDAERIVHGDESANGPTIRDMNQSGTYDITGSANLTAGTGDEIGFAERMRATFSGTFLEEPLDDFATRWEHVTPWLRPVWMSGWDFVWAITAILLSLVWGGAELIAGRHRIGAAVQHIRQR
ncbi:ArsR family transcriptional regulator [Halogeometricum borinquense]|uniref:ArsR family transcriptional regulator n=1 Tax=Halogeometricum borinquense TaxID=60847 RepID=A0A482T526_9EURY|nr:aryl-sulfate sulfotransferase [Halogeometricum borinquense]RYJ12720.1 ArsR family transcriptional regulator [Halogeometricum borinquense]